MIPERPNEESVKHVLGLLDWCPECGGHGFVYGYDSDGPVQHDCTKCKTQPFFWVDSHDYIVSNLLREKYRY